MRHARGGKAFSVHVEQHYHHGDVVNPVQHVTNVLDEFVSVIDNDGLDLGQSKYGPEQRLEALFQAGQKDAHRRKWGDVGEGEEDKRKVIFGFKQTINQDAVRKGTEEKNQRIFTVFNFVFILLLQLQSIS